MVADPLTKGKTRVQIPDHYHVEPCSRFGAQSATHKQVEPCSRFAHRRVSNQASLNTTVPYAFARDKHSEDVIGLWKYYFRLMSQVILHGLGSEVPTSIDATLNDNVDPPCIMLK
eukprot:732583-Prorocentrum_lima.AAC.1